MKASPTKININPKPEKVENKEFAVPPLDIFSNTSTMIRLPVVPYKNDIPSNKKPDEKPICFILNSDNGKVLFPLIIRELQKESYFPKDCKEAYDLVTPYGYGGPFFWDSDNPHMLAEQFWTYYEKLA